MSSVISIETFNHIKSLSKEYKITNSFLRPNKNKQVLRSQLAELVKKLNSPINPSLCTQLDSWLHSLSPSDLFPVFSTQNPLICTFLIEMNLKIQSDGNFDFALVNNPEKRINEFSLDKLFYMRKGSREEKIMTKKEFESALRFVDTDDYLDTLCIEPKVLRNIDKLLELFDFITSEAAFKSPCMVYWDSNSKKWMQEYPAWHRHSLFFSLAHWACAALEREVWYKFFTMNGLDPRGPGESTNFVYEGKVLHSIEIVQILPEFLRSLSKTIKEDLIGDHLTIKTIFDDVKEKLRNFKPENFSNKTQSFTHSFIDNYKSYKDQTAFDQLLNILRHHSEEVLVEFLLCTPLDRALTAFDLTLRIISLKVKEMYTKKIAEELMADEKKKVKKVKKRRKNKAKGKDLEVINGNGNPAIEKTEINGNKSQVTQEIVHNIMKNMYEFIENQTKVPETQVKTQENIENTEKKPLDPEEFSTIDETEFKIVNQKKKPRKTQPDSKPTPSQRPKPQSKHQSYKPSPPPKPQSKNEKSLKSSWQTQSSPIKSSVDPIEFPPLFSSFSSNSTPLHSEIINFVSQNLSNLSKKYQALSQIKNQIKEIIETHFAGSLFVYGSYATGLAVQGSDIDLAVSTQESLTRDSIIKNCLYLSEVLSGANFVRSISPIITASVPLVKIEANLCPSESIPITNSIDITFVNKFEVGDLLLKVNEFMQELQRTWKHFHPIALFLKSFFYVQGLNSVYSGIR